MESQSFSPVGIAAETEGSGWWQLYEDQGSGYMIFRIGCHTHPGVGLEQPVGDQAVESSASEYHAT